MGVPELDLATVQQGGFPLARRAGYAVPAVTAFVAEVSTWVGQRAETVRRVRAGETPTDVELAELARTTAAVAALRLPLVRRAGYEVGDVDAFVALVRSQFAAQDVELGVTGSTEVAAEPVPQRRRWWSR